MPFVYPSSVLMELSSLILAERMYEAGIRAFVGKLSMDISSRPSYVEPSPAASLHAAKAFITALRSLFPFSDRSPFSIFSIFDQKPKCPYAFLSAPIPIPAQNQQKEKFHAHRDQSRF